MSIVALAQKMEVLENWLSAFYTIESRLQQVEQFAAVNSQNSQSVKFIISSHAGSQQQCRNDSRCSDTLWTKLSESSSVQFPPSGDSGNSQVVNSASCDDGETGLPTRNVVACRGLRNKTSIKQQQKVNTKRILGEGAVGVSIGLQSAVPIIRKAVFHIDNLSPASTVTTVQDHLQRHNIQVLSCHGAKSWMQDDESCSLLCVH